MKKLLLLSLILFMSMFCFAQNETSFLKINFKSGQQYLTPKNKKLLSFAFISLKNKETLLIKIVGHADNVGTKKSNYTLGLLRAKSVSNFLRTLGFNKNNITVASNGAVNPIATNNTKKGRYANRRVEINFQENFPIPIRDKMPSVLPTIQALYNKLEVQPQKYCIDNNRDTIITLTFGTIVYIKAQSFILSQACKNTCVCFFAKELFQKSDMILDNVTTTSNGKRLISQGMVFTDAEDCNKQKLALQTGKDLVFIIPSDTIVNNNQIFEGSREHDSTLNWTFANNSILSNFTIEDINYCGNILCGGVINTPQKCNCKFFFCRIGRLGKGLKGIVNKNQRILNKSFRDCLQQTKKPKPIISSIQTPITNSQLKSNDSVTIANEKIKKTTCDALEALFKKYKVKNMEDLLLAINKPLLEKYGVKTLRQLDDTLAKENYYRIELDYKNQKINFTDLSFYIFNTSDLGWKNVDCFSNYPKDKLTYQTVNLSVEPNVDCKLVFNNSRSIIAANRKNSKYSFLDVPKGEPATVVALKYENQIPFLALKKVFIGENQNIDIEFMQYSLEELKEKLKMLDK